jgi:hypothetical protein
VGLRIAAAAIFEYLDELRQNGGQPVEHLLLQVTLEQAQGCADRGEPTAHTEYPNNSIRILQFGEKGKVTIWEISIVSQAGNFFLAVSSFDVRVYTAQGGRALHIQGFSKPWREMSDFIMAVARAEYDPATLLPLSCYTEAQKENSKGLAPHTGRVLWWSMAQGFGSIVINNHHGESVMARVHWQNLDQQLVRKDSRLAHLVAGEIVSYTALNEPENTKGRGTTFQVEAVGVRLLTPDFVPPPVAQKPNISTWNHEERRRMEELATQKKPSEGPAFGSDLQQQIAKLAKKMNLDITEKTSFPPAKEAAPTPVATTPPPPVTAPAAPPAAPPPDIAALARAWRARVGRSR